MKYFCVQKFALRQIVRDALVCESFFTKGNILLNLFLTVKIVIN